jgi:hypothetical protein
LLNNDYEFHEAHEEQLHFVTPTPMRHADNSASSYGPEDSTYHLMSAVNRDDTLGNFSKQPFQTEREPYQSQHGKLLN